ncbi:hypothetical protein [Cryptosporangium phraense]|uniref:Phosphotransferase n=1 Tax=Cryptosporangium phraense TaxID=2593070 RepID=A0A545AZP7_9ACTN|nr:hypothetical protein [Cryptosporangium phraense]TQS46797.1 hypothetical protein FL583_00515 [Cryptosporangium phraense]
MPPSPSDTTADAVIAAAAAALHDRFGSVRITGPERLSGSSRAQVFRARTSGEPGTVILKTPTGVFPPRERAALTLLSRSGVPGAPRLLAVADDPEVLVLADAGRGPSLADRLTGSDPDAATEALLGWAEATARFQAATVGLESAYADELASLSPLGPPPLDTSAELLAEAAAELAAYLPQLGVVPDPAALAVLATAADRFEPTARALDPGDACPDNNVETPAGLVLIDFEFAEFRSVAWQAAYLRVPWPSCWCSWRMPPDVAGRALDRWRATLAPALPAVATPEFDETLDRAVVAWVLLTTAWFLPSALAGDPPTTDPRRPRPSRRQILQYRLGLLAEASMPSDLEPLRALAAEAHAATRRAWGNVPLPLAPAYR